MTRSEICPELRNFTVAFITFIECWIVRSECAHPRNNGSTTFMAAQLVNGGNEA